MRKVDRWNRLQCVACGTWKSKHLFKSITTTAKSGKEYAYYLSRCTECWTLYNRANVKAWKLNNRAYATQRNTAKRHALRVEFTAAYGGKCGCCGETRSEFLTTEHIHGHGTTKKVSVYIDHARLKRAGWPKDRIALLCFNCNSAKGVYGSCPHTWKSGEVHKPLSVAERTKLYQAAASKVATAFQ